MEILLHSMFHSYRIWRLYCTLISQDMEVLLYSVSHSYRIWRLYCIWCLTALGYGDFIAFNVSQLICFASTCLERSIDLIPSWGVEMFTAFKKKKKSTSSFNLWIFMVGLHRLRSMDGLWEDQGMVPTTPCLSPADHKLPMQTWICTPEFLKALASLDPNFMVKGLYQGFKSQVLKLWFPYLAIRGMCFQPTVSVRVDGKE